MAILNYTTTVPAAKTTGEIVAILTKAKAREVSFEYDDEGDPVAIKFAITFLENLVWYRLAPNHAGVLDAMRRDKVPQRYKNGRQAFNVSWRIMKIYIAGQITGLDGEFSTPRTSGRPMHKATHLQTQVIAQLTDADPTLELVSWPTPCQQDGPKGGPNQGTDRLSGAADLATWATPRVQDQRDLMGSKATINENGRMVRSTGQDFSMPLCEQTKLASWMTTSTEDAKTDGQNIVTEYQSDIDANRSSRTSIQRLRNQVQAQLTDSGEMPSGSIAATGNGVLSGQLNPGHSRWLMSLPPIWDVCGIRAADAIKSRRSSKKAKAASQGSEATATP
jgi:hypothetical protein